MLSRRELLAGGMVAAMPARRPRGLRIGAMDGALRQRGKPGAVALARKLGLAGLQVTIGQTQTGGRLPLEDPELQAIYLAESAKHNITLNATYLDILHLNCLKDDPLARQWVLRGIEITRKLKARILMTVFFGKCAVVDRREIDYTADVFKELAPEAEKAGVVIGFENTLSAEDNARAMDRVGSRAFQIYYDVGNSTNMGGFDVPREIRFLGKERICQFHFKDKRYLGEGKVNYPAILEAIAEIGYEGYANLETSAPSGDVDADVTRNLQYLQRLLT